MSKTIIAGVSVVCLLGLSGCSSSDDTVDATPAATVTTTATVTVTAEATPAATVTETVTVTAPTGTGPDDDTATDPGDAAGSVSDGTLTYTLLDVTYPESIDAFGDTEEPDGQFVHVTLNVANDSNDAVDFTGWDQQLIDDQGRTHDTSDVGDYLDDAFTYDTINPGLSKDGSLVFDIPNDSTAEALLLSSDIFGENPVRLELSD